MQFSRCVNLSWRPPAFPYRLQHSIIGRPGLNHRVRDGYGCYPWAHQHQQLRVLDDSTVKRASTLRTPKLMLRLRLAFTNSSACLALTSSFAFARSH